MWVCVYQAVRGKASLNGTFRGTTVGAKSRSTIATPLDIFDSRKEPVFLLQR